MPTVHLTTGLPASGKTTLARQMVADSDGRMRRVNLDDLRAMLDGGYRDRDAEQTTLRMMLAAVSTAVDDGYDVIVDNTHLQRRIPGMLRTELAGRAHFTVHDLTHVSVEECITRDFHRRSPVGAQTIRSMWRSHQRARRTWQLTDEWMNQPPPGTPYTPDLALPAAVLCDLDGTLALHRGRNPYDAARCESDELNLPVRQALDLFRRHFGDTIILLSGRSDEFRPHTERWLQANNVSYDELWMRPAGDTRRDEIVKAELFDQHVRDRYAVRFSLDDRDRVVALWRRIGLPTWQVNYGAF